MVAVTITIKTRNIARLFANPNGQPARRMLRLAKKVEAQAKRNLKANVDTGQLRASVTSEVTIRGGVPVGRVGTNLKHGLYLHEGTGIYGPRKRPITPKRGKYLVFRPKRGRGIRGNRLVFARSVKGMKPNPYLRNALRVLR